MQCVWRTAIYLFTSIFDLRELKTKDSKIKESTFFQSSIIRQLGHDFEKPQHLGVQITVIFVHFRTREDVRTSGHLDVQTSGFLDVWTSDGLDVPTSGRLDVDVQTRERLDYRTSGRAKVRTSQCQDVDVRIDVSMRTSHFWYFPNGVSEQWYP